MLEIPIKTKKEIKKMREAGALLGSMLKELKEMSEVGLDVWELEAHFIQLCKENKCKPACKGYRPMGFPSFPTGLCLSIDEQAVHCFPVKGRLLQDGDMITLDTVIEYKGMFVDSAITYGIGKLPANKQKITDVTQEALDKSIEIIKPGIRIGQISNTMQKIVESAGYSVLEDYAGHGIGREMHEPPEIPCYGETDEGPTIEAGMVLAIEPLVCENSNVLEHHNYWETKTVDKGLFAQQEHTVLVTDNGYEILTKRL